MLTLFEFSVFGIYLAMLLALIVGVQVYNPSKFVRESLEVQESTEPFVESELIDPDSDEDQVFDPSKETYTMTENPMLRHRISESQNAMEMVD
jgi:hypothetical protein